MTDLIFRHIPNILLTAALLFAPCLAHAEDHAPFLSVDELPNAILYLPAPPEPFSEQFKSDLYYYQWGKKQRKTPRGDLAKEDAVHTTENIAKTFSPALGLTLSPKTTPYIYALIGRVRDTASQATKKGKKFFNRLRPYAYFNEYSLLPEAEQKHNPNSSYPSGHASMGWAVALVLTEIAPQAQDEILRRGYEYGNSRIIAGYHFESDVNAGRMAGSATVARLHADDEFTLYLKRAKDEYKMLIDTQSAAPAPSAQPQMNDAQPDKAEARAQSEANTSTHTSSKNQHSASKRKAGKSPKQDARISDRSMDLQLPF